MQMCLVDSGTVCYVSVWHYLSGFDPRGAKHSSLANSALRQTDREGTAALENGAFVHQVLVDWLQETTSDFDTSSFQ